MSRRVRGGPEAGWAATAALLAACAATREPPAAVGRARALLEASRRPRGNVALRCSPRDAEVLVDGVLQGLCSDFEALPAGLTLAQGLHGIEVRRAGFWPYTTYVEPHGARATLHASLRPLKPGAEATEAKESK